MLWTKPPPNRVVTLAFRWSRRITVSEPDTFGASNSRGARDPKSCVTVSRVPPGALPGPAPQPADSAASAPRSASSAAGRPRLANVEHTAVAAPISHAVAVERPVDRRHVEDVVAPRQARREQVGEVRAVADREEEPGPALRADEPLALAAVGEAAVADAAREPQLHGAQPGPALGHGDVDEPRGELREAVDVAAARREQARARGGAIDRRRGHAGHALRRGAAHGDDERVRPDRARLRRLEPLGSGRREGTDDRGAVGAG